MGEMWLDRYRMKRFEFADREALIVFPEKAEEKRRWMLKTEYFGAFPQLEYELLDRGWHLAYLKNRSRWGTLEDLDAKYAFSKEIGSKWHLSPRCVPVGMSLGGLHAVKQAALYPDMVSCLYLDAPVINILSYPFGFAGQTEERDSVRQEALNALSLDMIGMISYRDHPLDHIPELIRYRIPVCLVWGDSDTTVPFAQNGAEVLKAYQKTDIPFLTQSKPGVAHHPHGPADMREAIDFITRF